MHIRTQMTGLRAVHDFFAAADRAKLRIFHKERNHWGCSGYLCVEYAFVSEPFLREANAAAVCPSGYSSSPSTVEPEKTISVAKKTSSDTEDEVFPPETRCTERGNGTEFGFLRRELRTPCRKQGYSQGNQDCQLDAIFDNIGTTNKYCEFALHSCM